MSSFNPHPVIGLFVDDNQDNIDDVEKNCKPYITTILVDARVIDDKDYTARMINPPNVNEYAMISYTNPEKSYHALNDKTIKKINDWYKNNTGIPKVVIFDWDKTLSVVDGIISLHSYLQYIYNIIKEKQPDFIITQQEHIVNHHELLDGLLINALDYFMGGIKRKNKIKNLIKTLFNNGIQVYILTNNLCAITDEVFFKRMLQQLHEQLPNNLFFSGLYNPDSKSYNLIPKSEVINKKIIPDCLKKYTTSNSIAYKSNLPSTTISKTYKSKNNARQNSETYNNNNFYPSKKNQNKNQNQQKAGKRITKNRRTTKRMNKIKTKNNRK